MHRRDPSEIRARSVSGAGPAWTPCGRSFDQEWGNAGVAWTDAGDGVLRGDASQVCGRGIPRRTRMGHLGLVGAGAGDASWGAADGFASRQVEEC